MNQRIRALAEKANIEFTYDPTETPVRAFAECWEDELEKFAQLLVQECVEQLRYTVLDTQELRRDKSTDYQVGWEDGMFDAEEMIKQHFGVES